jgi:hypothetical protein
MIMRIRTGYGEDGPSDTISRCVLRDDAGTTITITGCHPLRDQARRVLVGPLLGPLTSRLDAGLPVTVGQLTVDQQGIREPGWTRGSGDGSRATTMSPGNGYTRLRHSCAGTGWPSRPASDSASPSLRTGSRTTSSPRTSSRTRPAWPTCPSPPMLDRWLVTGDRPLPVPREQPVAHRDGRRHRVRRSGAAQARDGPAVAERDGKPKCRPLAVARL